MKKAISIYQTDDLSQGEFDEKFFHGCQPVIIKQGLKGSEIFTRWTPEYLKNKMGSKKLNMDFSSTGIYNYNEKDIRPMTLPFNQMVDLFMSGTGKKGMCYLTQSSIPKHFPQLQGDLEVPQWIKPASDMLNSINLWFGCKGCVTPLHIDEGQNFLLQVMGAKELTLFAPSDGKYLYQDVDGKNKNLSKVNVENIDYQKFPLVKNAQPYHGILEAGDILYMPPLWWHQVRSLETAISVNYWWHRFEIISNSGIEDEHIDDLKVQIQSFLDYGIQIDQPDYQGETMLVKAVRNGYVQLVDALLSLGANPNCKSKIHKKEIPALTIAVEGGNVDIIKLFIYHQADIRALDMDQKSALDVARQNNDHNIIHLLEAYS